MGTLRQIRRTPRNNFGDCLSVNEAEPQRRANPPPLALRRVAHAGRSTSETTSRTPKDTVFHENK